MTIAPLNDWIIEVYHAFEDTDSITISHCYSDWCKNKQNVTFGNKGVQMDIKLNKEENITSNILQPSMISTGIIPTDK